MSFGGVATVDIEPIIRVPRSARPGETYLMTVDLRHQVTPDAWPYAREEYALTCLLDTLPLFEHQPLGEPTLLLHRFGGTYGEVRFLLKAADLPATGSIRLTLVNEAGLPVATQEIRDICIGVTSQPVGETTTVPLIPAPLGTPGRLLCLDVIRQIEPFAFQIRTVLRFLHEIGGRGIIADEVGLGKSVQACMIIQEYVLRRQVSNWLLVVPSHVREQWKYVMRNYFDLSFVVARDTTVTNREGGLLLSLAHAKGRISESLLRRQWDLIVIDECHTLRNRQTQAYRLVSRLTTRYCLLMTATPVVNGIRDLYNLVELCRPGFLGSWQRFRDGCRVDSQADRDRLLRRLSSVLTRTTRSETGLLWPSRIYRSINVELTTEESRYHRETIHFLLDMHQKLGQRSKALQLMSILIVKELMSSKDALLSTLKGPLRRRMRELSEEIGYSEALHQLEQLIRTIRSCPHWSKFEVLLQILEQLPRDKRKVVIFTQFKSTLSALVKSLGEKMIPAVGLHGDLSMRQMQHVLESFRKSEVGLMISTDFGTPWINLTVAGVVVNFDIPWNARTLENRIMCLDRPRQERDIRIVSLYAKDTIESVIQQQLPRSYRSDFLRTGLDLEANIARLFLESKDLADAQRRVEELLSRG